MSIEKPKSCNEWVQHILNVIKDEDLLHQAKIIASPSFETRMLNEGLDVKKVSELEGVSVRTIQRYKKYDKTSDNDNAK